MPRVPFLVTAWCFAAVIFPLIVLLSWPASYGIYAGLVVLAIFASMTQRYWAVKIPQPMLWKWAFLLVVTLVHLGSYGQVANTASLLLADFAIVLLFGRYAWDPDKSELFFRRLLLTCVVGAGVGLVVSTVFAAKLGIRNPLQDLFAGERVRIYATRQGHTILADFAFVAGLLAAANLGGHRRGVRVAVFAAALVTLILTKTATSWLLIVAMVAVPAIEYLTPQRAKAAVYGLGGVVLATLLLVPELLTGVLEFIRYTLLGRSESFYAGTDLTAGRALLNSLYWDGAWSSPLVGLGHSDRLLTLGSQVALGPQRVFALVESPFRVAAEYGWPFALAVYAFVLAPLAALFSADRRVRIFSLGLSVGLISWMTSNSLFGVAHQPQYFFYAPLLLIAAAPGFLGARRREPVGAHPVHRHRVPGGIGKLLVGR